MKHARLILCIAVMAAITAFKKGDADSFKNLLPLIGTWKMATKSGSLYEVWHKVSNTHLQNISYKVRPNGDTLKLESVALTQTSNGIFYTASVPDQNEEMPVPFKLTAASENRFIFENPLHDFPKRIVYELVNKDSLHAFVDDGNDASNKRSHYYFNKTQ